MNELEAALYKAITDMRPYLSQLVLVGGWVPYVYKKFIWKNIIASPQHTTDVDFGIPSDCKASKKSVYDTLSQLRYPERHLQMDRLFPIVPQIQTGNAAPQVPLEFLCDSSHDLSKIKKLLGPQIQLNALQYFDVLLSDTLIVAIKMKNIMIDLRIPSESIFVFHKLITYQLREAPSKAAKDLYYAYYMLRYSPHANQILQNIQGYHSKAEWKMVKKGLQRYFNDAASAGVLMVEREFGPDPLIANLRQHILQTFQKIQ